MSDTEGNCADSKTKSRGVLPCVTRSYSGLIIDTHASSARPLASMLQRKTVGEELEDVLQDGINKCLTIAFLDASF